MITGATALAVALLATGCVGAPERDSSTPAVAEPAEFATPRNTEGRYSAKFEAFFEGTDIVDVPFVLNLRPGGLVDGSWEHTTTVTTREGEAEWGTTGSFVARFLSDDEFVGQGTAGERFVDEGPVGAGISGVFQVRGLVGDNGLIIGTLFFSRDDILFQAIAD
jgi:hypothetical protein